jgi:hypothetical protein
MGIDKSGVVVCVTWYGRVPRGFGLFVDSCARNADIDFLFISDLDLSAWIAGIRNLTQVRLTLSDLSELISRKTGIGVNIRRPYKICDYKPAIGHICEEYLKSYDYWGHCDTDLIFGPIRKLLGAHLQTGKHVISIVPNYISGSFFLVRNTPEVNRLYQKSRDWKEIFQDVDNNYRFDEASNACDKMAHRYEILQNPTESESFTEVVVRCEQSGEVDASFLCLAKEVMHEGEALYCNNGSIRDGSGKEWVTFHYVGLKRTLFFTLPEWSVVPDEYVIHRFGVFRSREHCFFLRSCVFGWRQVLSGITRKMPVVWALICRGQIHLLLKAVVLRIAGK